MFTSYLRRFIPLVPKHLIGWLAYHIPRRKPTYSQFAEDIALSDYCLNRMDST